MKPTAGYGLGWFIVVVAAGCASGSHWFQAGPRPSELVGVWIDVEKTTEADTVAWVLEEDGDDRTLHLRVLRDTGGGTRIERNDRRYGSWYLFGDIADTAGRMICFKQRPRDGATCRTFRLDSLPGLPLHRRLTILGYPGEHHVSGRVLVQRVAR